MEIGLTSAQQNRLIELGEDTDHLSVLFCDAEECNRFFQKTEEALVKKNREKLSALMKGERRPSLCGLEETLAAALREEGFLQVTTPIILSKKFLNRMTIDDSHPLNDQVFWIDKNSCLRPMLAPNLYDISKKLMAVAPFPLRVFEIGSCFRKESEGKSHLKEFTMLNLVEWGLKEEDRVERLKQLAKITMNAAAIADYQIVEEDSTVYGKGLDIVDTDGLELASTSMGPHKLDAAWKISCTWVGLGFGLERLLMSREKSNGIHRYSKSLSYLDGAYLSIK
ncbi:MAG: pyrrolysine--tRNA(Pyl) ligase large subunit [Oscillospiraceae bacterium]|nr:pyrrolysine--tRNA(Pyl) ligase large subunit [Oscillospiraceae bacterium]